MQDINRRCFCNSCYSVRVTTVRESVQWYLGMKLSRSGRRILDGLSLICRVLGIKRPKNTLTQIWLSFATVDNVICICHHTAITNVPSCHERIHQCQNEVHLRRELSLPRFEARNELFF